MHLPGVKKTAASAEGRAAFHLGLLGHPLGHSLSPRLHRAALAACKLQGDYRLFDISMQQDNHPKISTQMAQLRDGNLQGLNVTIPWKQDVMKWIDEITPDAASVGAVNTLIPRDRKIIGENTDVPGFLADLQGWLGKEASGCCLVLGAGGAARAAAYALQLSGWEVVITSRREEQSIAASAALGRVSHLPWIRSSFPKNIHLLVNATPLGMFPEIQGTPWPDNFPLPPGCAVYDLVYNPAETRLLAYARRLGLPVRNGLGMLVEQAALAFEAWTGCDVPRQVLWEAVGGRREEV